VVEDYNLSPSYHAVIVKSIQDQLSDFKAHSGLYDLDGAELSSPIAGSFAAALNEAGTPKRGSIEGDDEKWWANWRERLNRKEKKAGRLKKKRKVAKSGDGMDGDVEDWEEGDTEIEGAGVQVKKEKPLRIDEIEINEATMHEDMRILIKVRTFFLSLPFLGLLIDIRFFMGIF
jgi:SWI/SNF-related matrix-associated actin-dependent regulator of chromatin subfamily B protein 1